MHTQYGMHSSLTIYRLDYIYSSAGNVSKNSMKYFNGRYIHISLWYHCTETESTLYGFHSVNITGMKESNIMWFAYMFKKLLLWYFKHLPYIHGKSTFIQTRLSLTTFKELRICRLWQKYISVFSEGPFDHRLPFK